MQRLYVLSGSKSEGLGWLNNKKLKGKYEKIPVNRRRHLSAAAHIYLKAHDKMEDYWRKRMFSDQDEYREHRKKNKKSNKEVELWVDNGLKKLKTASSEFKRRINGKLKKEANLTNLWLYVQFLILRFYSQVQLRNDLATVRIKGSKGNFLKKVKGSTFELVMNDFKASDKIGQRVIKLPKALSKVIKDFVKYRGDLVDHDFLLSNSKAAYE